MFGYWVKLLVSYIVLGSWVQLLVCGVRFLVFGWIFVFCFVCFLLVSGFWFLVSSSPCKWFFNFDVRMCRLPPSRVLLGRLSFLCSAHALSKKNRPFGGPLPPGRRLRCFAIDVPAALPPRFLVALVSHRIFCHSP